MSEHSSICIVWPAWFEGSIDPELHVTAVFLGKTTDLNGQSPSKRAAVQDVVDAFRDIAPGPFSMMPGIDWFGREKDIPVLRLYSMFSPALRYTRDVMAEHLTNLGIKPSDDFGFIPHITMSNENLPARKQLPRIVYLEAPVLWWGNDREIHSNHRTKEAA
jgi:2'-5' RNA ligase